MFIYKITNITNEKNYIGKSKNVEKRWKKHIRNALTDNRSGHFYTALRKYGPDCFSVETILCSITKEDTNHLEKLMIKQYDSIRNGYNLTEGGDGGTNESFRKLSRERKGKTLIEQYGIEKAASIKAKMSKSMIGKLLGRIISNDCRKKISITLKEKYKNNIEFKNHNAEVNRKKAKKGENHPMFNKTHTIEARNKISTANKGRKYTDIQKKTRAEFSKGANNPFYKDVEIIKVLELMISNPHDTMENIGKIFGLSRPTISKKIKDVLQITNIQQYKNDIGIKKWIEFLRENNNNVRFHSKDLVN